MSCKPAWTKKANCPTIDDVAVQRLMSAFVPVPFNNRQSLGEGLIATFFSAGHIAGAAMLGLESSEGHCYLWDAVGFLWQGKD